MSPWRRRSVDVAVQLGLRHAAICHLRGAFPPKKTFIRIHKPFAPETRGVECVTTVATEKPWRSESAIKKKKKTHRGYFYRAQDSCVMLLGNQGSGQDWTFCSSVECYCSAKISKNGLWCGMLKENHRSNTVIVVFRMDLGFYRTIFTIRGTESMFCHIFFEKS